MEKMWIEAIRVRSSAAALEKASAILKEEVMAIKSSTKAQDAHLMQHAQYDGDMLISITWGDRIPPQKTREGLMLAERLLALGPVDHAVWVPVKQSNQCTV